MASPLDALGPVGPPTPPVPHFGSEDFDAELHGTQPLPAAVLELAEAFPGSTAFCAKGFSCLQRMTGAVLRRMRELKLSARAWSKWVDEGGPPPGEYGAAATARDTCLRGKAARRVRPAAIALRAAGRAAPARQPPRARVDPFYQLPSTRRARRFRWLDEHGSKLAREDVCTVCIMDTLCMTRHDMYSATLEGVVLLDRWDLRCKGTVLQGSRAQRGLLPLDKLAQESCCDEGCLKLIDERSLAAYWGKFEKATTRAQQDEVLAPLLFDARRRKLFCDASIMAWFGVGVRRLRSVYRASPVW